MKNSNIVKIAVLPITILIIIGMLLLVERAGFRASLQAAPGDFLPKSVIDSTPDKSKIAKDCLIITDSSKKYVDNFSNQMQYILDRMCVGYEIADVSASGMFSSEFLSKYKSLVVIVPDYASLSTALYSIFEWVDRGGKMFNLFPLESNPVTLSISKRFGVKEIGNNYTRISGIKIVSDFMIGSKNFEYQFSGSEVGVMSLRLASDVTVHAASVSGIPVLWERDFGEGRIVVNNLPFSGKDSRGYMSSAYCLLEDEFAYPVINTSAFYIDDCPGPLPYGYNEHLKKYYSSDTAAFLNNVWWPDMVGFAKQYDIKYTGMMIESFTDTVSPPYNNDVSLSDFKKYGNSILRLGGEIAYQGYSHQPLCYRGFDYMGIFEYTLWNSVTDSKLAFDQLVNLGSESFPGNTFTTYVPPSNILSEEGRKMLVSNYPQIKIISGVFQNYELEYEQEFGVSYDGMINIPRITSGITVDGYERWVALNELSFQYVNTHSFNLDEVLSPKEGENIGWEKAFAGLKDYMGWIYGIAPNLRRQSSAEAGKAVQRYATILVRRTITDSGLRIDIDNFYDSAYLLVRIKDGKPRNITGGTLEELGGGMFLLSADKATVNISIER